MHTPWGPSQQIVTITNGIMDVSTAGHGGIMLADFRVDQLPKGLESYSGWLSAWEEDCDWAIPFIIFYEEFDNWGPVKSLGKEIVFGHALNAIQYNKTNVRILFPYIEKIRRLLGKTTKNIYWKDITKEHTVIETKVDFKAFDKDGAIWNVYWEGNEAGRAQSWLKNQTIISNQLKQKG